MINDTVPRRKCVICQEPAAGSIFCKRCGRSYDKDAARDCTIAAAICWAARRTRRFERRKTRRCDVRKEDRLVMEHKCTQRRASCCPFCGHRTWYLWSDEALAYNPMLCFEFDDARLQTGNPFEAPLHRVYECAGCGATVAGGGVIIYIQYDY